MRLDLSPVLPTCKRLDSTCEVGVSTHHILYATSDVAHTLVSHDNANVMTESSEAKEELPDQ